MSSLPPITDATVVLDFKALDLTAFESKTLPNLSTCFCKKKDIVNNLIMIISVIDWNTTYLFLQ